MNKKEEIKENNEKKVEKKPIKSYEIVMIVSCLALLVVLVIMTNQNNTRAHCKEAICNEDSTICYTYKLDKQGKTVKTWEGSCKRK